MHRLYERYLFQRTFHARNADHRRVSQAAHVQVLLLGLPPFEVVYHAHDLGFQKKITV